MRAIISVVTAAMLLSGCVGAPIGSQSGYPGAGYPGTGGTGVGGYPGTGGTGAGGYPGAGGTGVGGGLLSQGGEPYRCAGGQQLTVAFSNAGEVAEIGFPDGRIQRLQRVPSPFGRRYSDGYTALMDNGNNVQVEVADRPAFTGCVASREVYGQSGSYGQSSQLGFSRYQCSDGRLLSVGISPTIARLTLDNGDSLTLPRMPGAAGRYGNERVMLYDDGRSINVEMNQRLVYGNCQPLSQAQSGSARPLPF